MLRWNRIYSFKDVFYINRNITTFDKIVFGKCFFNPIIYYWRCLFLIKIDTFHHFMLEIALAIPTLKERKMGSNNSAAQGLKWPQFFLNNIVILTILNQSDIFCWKSYFFMRDMCIFYFKKYLSLNNNLFSIELWHKWVQIAERIWTIWTCEKCKYIWLNWTHIWQNTVCRYNFLNWTFPPFNVLAWFI